MTSRSIWLAPGLVVAALALLARDTSASSPRLALMGGGIYFDDDGRFGWLGGIRGTFFESERVALALEGTFATTKETLALEVNSKDGVVTAVSDERIRRFFPVFLSASIRLSSSDTYPYALLSAGFATTTVQHTTALGQASDTWSSVAFQVGLGYSLGSSFFLEGSYMVAGGRGDSTAQFGVPPSESFRPGGAALRLGLRW